MERIFDMTKYIVYSTWYHEKGLRPADAMRDGMRKNVKPYSSGGCYLVENG